MVEKTIQSIPVMPFALMYGCISAVIGLIIGIFYAVLFGVISAVVPSTSSTLFNQGLFGLFFGVAAVIIIPVMSFVSGLIMAAIVALLYNFLAPRIGGVKVRFKEDNQVSPT